MARELYGSCASVQVWIARTDVRSCAARVAQNIEFDHSTWKTF